MKKRLGNYINGQWADSKTKEWLEVRNPATDEVIALCPESTKEEINQAVKAAQEAFWAWRTTPSSRRANLLYGLHEKMNKHNDEIAELIVKEHGKTLAEAKAELMRTMQTLELACSGPQQLVGNHAENVGTGVDTIFIREPIGPFVLIPPFNFPAMISIKFAATFATGNTAIVKAAEQCPNTITRIMEFVDELGFPKGVVNLVHGSGIGAGNTLITHPGTVGVSFVGSSRVGEIVYKTAAHHNKRAQCQAGAKNHVLIAEDAKIDEAMPNIVESCFGHVGERCFAVSNVLAVESVYEEVKEKFLGLAKKLVLGSGMEKGVTLGPVVSRSALDGILKQIDQGINEGAKLILDGRNPKVDGYPNGYFIAPTIFEAEPDMYIFQEEVFGPVRCLKKVKDLSEGIEIINRSNYGHSAVLYTENGGWAREFAMRAQTGHVGINVGTPAPVSFFPVGGKKISFFGDIHGNAHDMFEFFTDKKVITSRWHSSFKGLEKKLDDGFVTR